MSNGAAAPAMKWLSILDTVYPPNTLLTVSSGLFTWNVATTPSADIVFVGSGTRDSIEVTNYKGGTTYNLTLKQSSSGSDTLVIYQNQP